VDALVALAVLVAIAAGIGAIAYAVSYNRLIARRQEVDTSWSTIDVELQRRHVLVPQLVATVQQAAAHEQQLLVELSKRNAEAAAAPHTPAAATAW
jgi:LemA protein